MLRSALRNPDDNDSYAQRAAAVYARTHRPGCDAWRLRGAAELSALGERLLRVGRGRLQSARSGRRERGQKLPESGRNDPSSATGAAGATPRSLRICCLPLHECVEIVLDGAEGESDDKSIVDIADNGN